MMKDKPKKLKINFCHPLTKGLLLVELFVRPIKKRWFNKWHSVCIRDVDGKTQVYLNGNRYLSYDHKLSWWDKRKLRKHPFLMFKSVEQSVWKGMFRSKNFIEVNSEDIKFEGDFTL